MRVLARTILALVLCSTAAASGTGVAAPSPSGAGTPGRWVALAPSLLQRGEVSAARVGHAIYVVGGFGANSQSTAAVERFDLRHRAWSPQAGLTTSRTVEVLPAP